MNVADIQKRQEAQYHFPYHYIPYIEGNKFSQSKTLKWGYEYLSYIYFVINKISSLHFNTLLDVGCGDGRYSIKLIEKLRNRLSLTCVDVNYEMLQQISKISSNFQNLQTKQALQKRYHSMTIR